MENHRLYGLVSEVDVLLLQRSEGVIAYPI
jgi:hypothetical protein